MSIFFCVLAVFGVFLPWGQHLYGHILGMEFARLPKSREDGGIQRRHFIGLIEPFLVHWIFMSDNPLFSRKNHLSFLISSVTHIEDLGNLTCEYKWLVPIPNLVEVNRSEVIPVFLDTLTSLNPSTPKNGHLEVCIQEFLYLFNLTIV